MHLYCKDIFVPLRRTLRIQYLMWLYKCTSCPCIRAGFAFIAPEPISSATVIQIVIQKFFSVLDRFLKIRNFSPKIVRVIQTVIHIVIHDFRHLEKFIKIFKIGHSDSYRQDFKVARSIKFRIFNCSKLQNSYTYSDTKILSKHEKTAIE